MVALRSLRVYIDVAWAVQCSAAVHVAAGHKEAHAALTALLAARRSPCLAQPSSYLRPLLATALSPICWSQTRPAFTRRSTAAPAPMIRAEKAPLTGATPSAPLCCAPRASTSPTLADPCPRSCEGAPALGSKRGLVGAASCLCHLRAGSSTCHIWQQVHLSRMAANAVDSRHVVRHEQR